jgi:hypothetical protein
LDGRSNIKLKEVNKMFEKAITSQEDQALIMESVMLGGDLSKLTPIQRVSYYRSVCDSLGVNYLTKPFDYITLNGRLTLYARKDCTDQLRKINNISIVDVNIVETEKQFIVKVKGQDPHGRFDMEVGVVNKSDMRGDTANAQMKAVTKAKRRLTLSMCGLGWLDETEVQTIPDAMPIAVNTDTGEIVKKDEQNEMPDIEIVPVLGDWAVNEAAKYWNIEPSEAAKAISKKWHGKMDKREFLEELHST